MNNLCCFEVKSLEEGKFDSMNEEEFLKAQETQENQASNIMADDGKDLLGGMDSAGGLAKYGSRFRKLNILLNNKEKRSKGFGGGYGFGYQMPINPELIGFNPPLMNEFLLPMYNFIEKLSLFVEKGKNNQ